MEEIQNLSNIASTTTTTVFWECTFYVLIVIAGLSSFILSPAFGKYSLFVAIAFFAITKLIPTNDMFSIIANGCFMTITLGLLIGYIRDYWIDSW